METIALENSMDYLNELVESMQKKAEMTKGDIAADIRKMINNPEYSDVAFRCKDGARVHACRLILVARSEVLHRMLLNGMAESQLSEITLHEVSSTVLLPTLEFLYTGRLEEHTPKDWKNAYEIIGAARFFLLEALEPIVTDYLDLAVAKVAGDIEAAAKFLSITLEFVDILGETVEFIARDLVCVLESACFEPGFEARHLQALTPAAFLYFLQATENGEVKLEFLRLRSIILWCACKEFAPQTPLGLHAIPPEIKSTLELLDTSPFPDREKPGQSETYRAIKSRLANSVKQYLHLVDLRRIVPQVLVNIVEPMDIISSQDLMDVFRFNTLQTYHNNYHLHESEWSTTSKNHEIYRVGRGGSVIRQIAPGIGFARYDMTLNLDERFQHRGIFEWEITIEKVCDGFIEIGLLEDLEGKVNPKDGFSLCEQPGGWALRMDPEGFSVNRKNNYRWKSEDGIAPYDRDCSQLVYGEHFGHRSSKIKVCLDMMFGTCSFVIDNEDYGEAWDNMDIGTCFPAVCLGRGSGGRRTPDMTFL